VPQDKILTEIFEDELAEAANNLVIEEGEDDQEALRLMILDLQQSAYERGLLAGSAHQRELDVPAPSVQAMMNSEEVADLIAAIVRDGKATIGIVVSDD
jgi:hypothetical protein